MNISSKKETDKGRRRTDGLPVRLKTFILLFFIMLGSSMSLSARDHWASDSRYLTVNFDANDCCIHIKVLQGDYQYGPAKENGYIYDATIKFNDLTLVKIKCDDFDKIKDNVITPGIGKIDYKKTFSGTNCYMEYRWYPNSRQKSGSLKITGTWDVNGAYETDPINGDFAVNIPLNTEITHTGTTFDTQNFKTKINFRTSSTEAFNGNGYFYLYQMNQVIKKVPVDRNKKDYTIELDDISNYINDYTVKHEWKEPKGGVNYTSSSDRFSVSAYTFPRDLTVEYNDQDRVTKLTWMMTPVSGDNVIAYPYRVDRWSKKSNKWETIASIPYDQSLSSVTYVDKYFEDNLVTDTYKYRVKRHDGTEIWNHGKISVLSDDLYISTEHMDVKVGSQKVTVANGEATITWESNGNDLWSKGSKFILTRHNMTTTAKDEIELDKEAFLEKKYVDIYINSCDKYYYSLRVKPGSPNYATHAPQETNTFVWTEKGDMVSLDASKGYFKNYVELNWIADFSNGTLDNFIVERKAHGEPDSSYKQIANLESSASINEYIYKDVNCVAGIVYDYRVKGTLFCADSTLASVVQPVSIGYISPKGEIYGRTTFSSGQGVANVMMQLSSDASLNGVSYKFGGLSTDYVETNNNLLQTDANYTMQLMAAPSENNADGILLKKGNLELGLNNGKPYFKVGDQTINSEQLLDAGKFANVAGVYQKGVDAASDSIFLYVIKDELYVTKEAIASQSPVEGKLIVGKGFKGNIDEVRIWDLALNEQTLEEDYFRFLVGNENGLIVYWGFGEPVLGEVYDSSFGKIKHNGNHAKAYGNAVNDRTCDVSRMEFAYMKSVSYCGKTDGSGNYRIAGIPYEGSGTEYTLTPMFGVHQFAPKSKTIVIGESTSTFNIDFTDMSSFNVQGYVYYQNTNVPVKGANFYIDGRVAAKSNGEVISTDEKGEFVISVPVGIHEVKVKKQNHVFANEGKLVNINGGDLNYQDDMSNVKFWDMTTVKVIGKAVGGYKEFECPTGFSVSKNILADTVYLEMELKDYDPMAYHILTEGDSVLTVNHHISPYSNKVTFNGGKVHIAMNKETGEYVANLLPEVYNVTSVFATGYGNQISDVAEVLDLTSAFLPNYSTKEDSVVVNDPKLGELLEVKTDTVYYNAEYSYEFKVKPVFNCYEVVSSTNLKDKGYYGSKGEKQTFFVNGKNQTEDVFFWNEEKKVYNFGHPVYQKGGWYTYNTHTYYPFYFNNDKEGGKLYTIPVQNGKVKITNTIKPENVELEIDENGNCIHVFQASNVDITGANKGLRNMQITVVGDGQPAGNSFKVEGYVLGAENRGSDFTTQGPNNLLYVLRDPPGSHSSATLEEGTTVTHTVTNISNGWYQEGEDHLEHFAGIELKTSIGIGVATIQSTDTENTVNAMIEHHEEGHEEDTTVDEVTFTSTISTSDDPLYVGADGDVLVGYSTNMVLSQADQITIKRNSNCNISDQVIQSFGEDYVLCKSTAINVGQKFSTMFAYPQIHIEQVILPQLEEMILSYLKFDMTPAEAQAEADLTDKTVYVSKLKPDDPNFGLPNPGAVLKQKGDYYDVYFPKSMKEEDYVDQIDSCYVSIKNWKAVLAQNEEIKVRAITGQDNAENLSFQAGSSIEKSYSFSSSTIHNKSFDYTVGAGLGVVFGGTINGFGLRANVQETAGEVGGHSSEDETTTDKTYSFTLADEGDFDYLSVDVINMAADPNKGADMVFRLRGGATACPYEGEQYTKYFEPEMHKLSEGTLRIEAPRIEVEPAEVFNVPSNNPAVFTLRMTNESEVNSSSWFTLSLVDESIPHGAKLSIDGVPLSDGRTFLIPGEDVLTKTLEVRAGAEGYDYENMKIVLGSQCQCDPTGFQEVISDTVSISAHFIPTSTEVHIKSPGNNWTLNTECESEDGKFYLPIVIHDFDVNYRGFDRIEVQYKPKSESKQWNILRTFYKNEEDVKDPKREEWIDKNITLTANFFGDEDQNYDIRAVSYCNYSLGEGQSAQEITYESEVIAGIKDTKLPVLFGNPLPADGILDVEDEIRLNFSEEIADGYLTPSNFEVTGIKNGVNSDHSVSVFLNGKSDYIATEFDKNLTGKSLTAEMWVMPANAKQAGTFFTHGNGNQAFEIGMNGQGNLIVRLGAKTYTTKPVDFKPANWSHIMVSYNAETRTLLAYYNFDTMVLHESNVPVYEGIGTFQFGRSVDGDKYYHGNMHDFRLWDAAVAIEMIKENSLKVLSGLETSLMLYYPMNEGRGTELTEKARGNTAVMKGVWNTPEGRSVNFSGESYMVINSSEIAVRDDQNYTLEFWFRTNAKNANNQAIINNGIADGSDSMDAEDLFYIGFDGNNKLFYRNNKQVVNLEGNFADMQWHHFAVTVNRNAENAQIYMDGDLNQYFKTDSLGGVSGANMFVGASGKFENGAYTYGNYFNGNVDEIRLWNSHMDKKDISRNSNIRAKGTELGLMAYYPFEKYIVNTANVKEMVFTGEEMVEGKYSVELKNGAAESVEKAPLKSKGTEANILHDFVVNKDALIITLTEPEDRIEKTIINIAVKDVRDINGNKMDGTIRWSAYVDRNQLRWGEQNVNIDKEQYEPMEFDVVLNNVGGSVKSYSIEGMPAWLTAEPLVGEIGPKSNQNITFTVNEGTNVGTYDEVIYAVGENGVTEPLNLHVKVSGITPDWSVDPSKYEYSMIVFGKMRFEGIFSSDKEDMLAAFENGECIGVANSSYDNDQDMWYTFLTVYNNKQNSENVEFRMWDASTGKIYSAIPQQAIPFVNGSIAGTAKEPIVFDGKELFFQNIKLNAGWNWISFNLKNDNLSDVNKSLYNGQWEAGDQVKDNNTRTFASYSTKSGWVSDGLTFNNISSYLLYANKEQVLSTSGSKVDAKATAIPVKGGRWNYISYLPMVNMTVKEALAGYNAVENDVVRSQDQFAMFSGKAWIGNLIYMESGKGYMLYRKAADNTEFNYPTVEGSLSSGSLRSMVTFQNRKYDETMNIVATGDGIVEGDRILSFINGELRGISDCVATENGELNFINIAGQKEDNQIVLALEHEGEIVAYANNNVRYNSNEVLGTISEPYQLDFAEKMNSTKVYPVPFKEELNVQVSASNGDEIKINVINTMGQVIYVCNEVMPYDGTYTIKWDGRTTDGIACDEGIYLICIEINNEIETYKVTKTN